jgi:uncharacterized protein YjbJ (UPF0337 family)
MAFRIREVCSGIPPSGFLASLAAVVARINLRKLGRKQENLRRVVYSHGGSAMDKDRVKGTAHEAKGAVKEAAGKVTGDAKTQAEGKAEKVGGKVENAAGRAKDAARDAVNKD